MPAGDRKHPYRVGATAPSRSRVGYLFMMVPFIFLSLIIAAVIYW